MPDISAGAGPPPPLSPVETFSYSGASSPMSSHSPNPSPVSAHKYSSQGNAASRSLQEHKLNIPDSASKTRLEISSPDDMSIDNILDMLASPRTENKKPAPVVSTKPSNDDYHNNSHKTGIFERYGPGYGSDSKDGSSSSSLPSAVKGSGLQTMSPSSSSSFGQSATATFSASSSERPIVSFPSTSSRLSASVASTSSGSYSSGSSSFMSANASSSGSSAFPSSVSGAGGSKRYFWIILLIYDLLCGRTYIGGMLGVLALLSLELPIRAELNRQHFQNGKSYLFAFIFN